MSPTGVEQSPFFLLVWWVVAAVSVIAAILVVQLRDLLRAALALVVSFLSIAGLFVLLNAEFLAAVQVLIYAGAISILIIFAVLLTREPQTGNPSHRFAIPALLLCGLVLGVLVFSILATEWRFLRDAGLDPVAQQEAAAVLTNSTPVLARLLLREFLLPFEVASVLLVAALLGAIVLVRER